MKQHRQEGQSWCTPLLISASFDSLELNLTSILYCMYMSTVVFNNVSGIFLDCKYQIKSVFVYYHMPFPNL